MARRSYLMPVDGTAEPELLMSVSEAAATGSRLAELKAMRRVIAKRLDDESTPARDLAALSKRQMDISKEIDELMSEAEGDDIDEAVESPDEGFDPSSV